nr:protein sieve element occlusion b [Quercus suber]
MACNENLREETLNDTMESILGTLEGYSWHAQAVLTLAAFVSDYGDFCRHLDQFLSSDHLTKPVGIIKQIPVLRTQPKIDDKHKDAILKLNKLIKETFNFIDCIVMLGHLSVEAQDEPKSSTDNISFYVFWAIRTVIACTTWMSCLNKDESETEEFSRYDDKIADTLVELKFEIQKAEVKAYRKLKKFLKERHCIVEVLNTLIGVEDKEQPVKVFDNDTILINMEVVETKNVLLFFSGLDISEYVSILKPIYKEMKNEFKIMWIPIVEPWTNDTQKKFDIQRHDMPWYVVQQFSSISSIKYVKEQWQFKNEPIIVVLNPQGRVEHHNALHMIMTWGIRAIPFTCSKEDELTRCKEDNLRNRDDWFGSFMIEICPDSMLPTWIKDQKFIFIYGGNDESWSKEFHEKATKVKNESSARTSIELFCVGKDGKGKDELDNFWKLIANFLFAKFHKDTELDSGTKECLKLPSYRNEIEKRWVVLCKGSKLVFSGFGTTVLKVLGQFDEWKQFRGDTEFVKHLVIRYDKKLREDGIFRNFEIPKNDGLITDGIKCLDCSKTMDTKCFRLKCCCHQNHEAYSIKIKEETGVVGLDEDIQAVVSELISENKHVVCIVGMKGTGKTTQAKKIFDHSAIVGHFTARDWVTPTDQKAKQVWINKVCDILKKEKYLAVLDDFTAENEIKMPGKL